MTNQCHFQKCIQFSSFKNGYNKMLYRFCIVYLDLVLDFDLDCVRRCSVPADLFPDRMFRRCCTNCAVAAQIGVEETNVTESLLSL